MNAHENQTGSRKGTTGATGTRRPPPRTALRRRYQKLPPQPLLRRHACARSSPSRLPACRHRYSQHEQRRRWVTEDRSRHCSAGSCLSTGRLRLGVGEGSCKVCFSGLSSAGKKMEPLSCYFWSISIHRKHL